MNNERAERRKNPEHEPTTLECFEAMGRYVKRCVVMMSHYPHLQELKEDGIALLKLFEERRDRLVLAVSKKQAKVGNLVIQGGAIDEEPGPPTDEAPNAVSDLRVDTQS